MAVSKSIAVVFVGTRKSLAWAVTDRDRDRIADEVKVLAPSIKMKVPNGMCITNDGILYVVEHNRILILPAIEFLYESPDIAIDGVIEPLVPVEEESFNHGARTCSIGPDNKLYVTLGQPFNIPAKEKLALYKEVGLGGIIRMNRDGTGREVYVDGIRNSVGHAWNPANGELWFTDNQVDGMGNDIPPGELNRVTAKGQNFGFPWYGGGDTRTKLYSDEDPPGGRHLPRGRHGRARGGPGHDVLYGQAVPGEVPGRHLQRPARLVEPHDAGRRPRLVHLAERGWQRERDRALRPWLAG